MDVSPDFRQFPSPGKILKHHRGDTLTITLRLPRPQEGQGWLRTTVGQAAVHRNEIIEAVLDGTPVMGRDWFDVPMRPVDERTWEVRLPLHQVGWFEAKAYFLAQGQPDPQWPSGDNLRIRVAPADTVCANTIYNAFVRQFGPSKSAPRVLPQTDARILSLDREHYTVIPPSGTFRDLIGNLDFIIRELGCRIIQLLPIHPTPTTYARMGRFGSPYAALNFTSIDPALARFDPRATPLEQFSELVDAIHARQAKLFLDMAINHTGWAASLHETHPHWLARKPDGQIECPGAWGVTWEDLTKLDYSHTDLWQYMADIFLTWCRRGVDGFRCDAGYMIPLPAWRFMIARVRAQYPDTIFFLEGLGGKISVTQALMDTAGFDWAYSELFQNYNRHEIEHYLPQALTLEHQAGTLVHFAETHDNKRLASRSAQFATLRTSLCALFSHNGAFGFANGVEWLATEKINVHEVTGLNWGARPNQVALIQRLHALLYNHPAFAEGSRLVLLTEGEGERVVLQRTYDDPAHGPQSVWVVANLDETRATRASWPKPPGWPAEGLYDLISEQPLSVACDDRQCHLHLTPGQVLCIAEGPPSADARDLTEAGFGLPQRVQAQARQALVLDVWVFFKGLSDLENLNTAAAAESLCNDPLEFVGGLNPASREPRVISWRWPRDQQREVMLPPGHVLYVKAPHPFRVRLLLNKRCRVQQTALALPGRGWFTLLCPPSVDMDHRPAVLDLTVFEEAAVDHVQAPLLLLPRSFPPPAPYRWQASRLADGQRSVLATNGHGSVMRANAKWGHLNSRYDALLAVNPSPAFPDDRQIKLVRCRLWAVYQGYSHAIDNDCLDLFALGNDRRGRWRFRIPTGQGRWIVVALTLGLQHRPQPHLQLTIERHTAGGHAECLDDDREVRFVVRPDLEDRNFHHVTKAYTGPEHLFPQAIQPVPNGFLFNPHGRQALRMTTDAGLFVGQPEWQYMAFYPQDAERGLEAHTDLFSPGYFEFRLAGNTGACLTAAVDMDPAPESRASLPARHPRPRDASAGPETWTARLSSGLRDYLTWRNGQATVIAGYPWFLDWGRDALIFARGLIAAGQTEAATQIATLFGQYEREGMLPNMIQGHTPANWDTSDAPLWLIVVCRDLLKEARPADTALLDQACGQRTLKDVLISIGWHYRRGTPNGIRMDHRSGLIFSPAHFTWMDTNHPAGTPRQGFAIEIQALWYAALTTLAVIDPDARKAGWQDLAKTVQTSLSQLFYLPQAGYFSDCLHADPGQGAHQARADDALRPNQLLALTLDAVTDKTLAQAVLAACETLLVPGAIRSLADRPLKTPLPIQHQGHLLNNPHHPYQGRYAGDEDTLRKPAYHNGTAWTWPFPSYAEAWVKIYGPQAAPTAQAWLSSSTRLLQTGSISHLPEILDGNAPHQARGCDAQAWGLSELLRVFVWLSPEKTSFPGPAGEGSAGGLR